MSLLQTTAEEEKRSEYCSASPDTTSTEEISPTSATANAASLEDISITARQVRPDELMAALAAIDARKNATVAGTIPLGNALERMQADVTPEEVWLEVYAGRLQQRKSGGQVQSADTLQHRKRFWATGGALAGVFGIAIVLRLLTGGIAPSTETTGSRPALPTGTQVQTPPQQQLIGPFQQKSPNSVPLPQIMQAGGMIRMNFSEFMGLSSAVHGTSYAEPMSASGLNDLWVDPVSGQPGDWPVYVHDGKIYLRGWIDLPPDADKTRALAQKVRIYSRPDHPELKGKVARQISVLGDGIEGYSAQGSPSGSKVECRLSHLDGEAWKLWKPLPE